MRISRAKQENLWGRQGTGLEPQRSDLYYADFTQPLALVNQWFQRLYGESAVAEIFPQFVASVTLPAVTVRAETYRKGSVDYQAPGFDAPLDAIKVKFIAAQNGSRKPYILDFLTRWKTLVRLGRGSRSEGHSDLKYAVPEVDGEEGFTYTSHFQILLLRGSAPMGVNVPYDLSRLEAVARANTTRLRAQADSLKTYGPVFQATGETLVAQAAAEVSTLGVGDLEVSQIIQAGHAWLGSYQISNLDTSTSAGLVSVEATLYAESLTFNDPSGSLTQLP